MLNTALAPSPLSPPLAFAPLADARGRVKRKLRLSLTDRCNLRCTYCMPEQPRWLPRKELLTRSEIVALARTFVRELGITELRLTGGEPLLRPDTLDIVRELDALRSEGLHRIALTTNGALLPRLALPLRAAGLDDLNVSLDAAEPDSFRALTRGELAPVLAGIDAARSAGLPLKLNCVVVRGRNEDQVLPLARWARERNLPLRYIEFMPLDGRGDWSRERVVDEAEIRERLAPLGVAERQPAGSDPATYYRLADGWRYGVIPTISRPFCKSCDRLRVDARGELYTCLFSARGHALRPLLQADDDGHALAAAVRHHVWRKDAGYAEQPGYVERPITMHHLGG